MKNLKSYIGVLMMGVVALFASCSPESFEGADPNGIPSLDGVEPVVQVDQEINQVTFSLPADLKGCMPVWIFYENKGTAKEKVTYSTVNGLKKIFAKAGDYDYEFKLMNRNGLSDGSKAGTFHIDNTIMDFGKYFTQLCGGKDGGASKEWRIDNDKQGHLGCGPSGTTGTEWWSAAPNDKKDWNVYDSRMTFTANGDASKGGYHFNPGESGQIYVNKDVAAFGGANGQSEDFCVDATEQDVDFEFEVSGEDLYLVFPEHTYFPYIANDDIWNTPRYKVESITPSEINLVIDNGGIAWHYILTSGAAAVVFKGFDANSEDNLWKTTANPVFQSQYYSHTGSWEQLPDYEHSEGNNEYTVKLPTASDMQWQAQYCLGTDLNKTNVIPGTSYDFSCIVVSNVDLPSVTVKLTSPSDDPSLVNNQGSPAQVKAYEETVIYFTEQVAPEFDGNYKLVLDFGGNPENAEITVKDIVVIEHSKNKIEVPAEEPGEDPDTPVMDWNAESPANLWAPVESGEAFVSVTPWFADNGWGQISNPEWTHENGVWTVTMPEGMGGSQWQGQFPINTTLTASGSKKYNFYCVLEADNDCPGVTIKLTESDEADGTKHDNNFFFADRHDVKAYTPFIYKAEGVTLEQGTDAKALSLFFDFGGTPAGTNVKISKIYFEEAVSMDYNDADNLWKAVDNGDAFISVTPWFANDGWSQIADPVWEHNGNTWELVLSDGMGGSQWQGQFPINTTLTASQADTYNFSCTVEIDNDAPGVTIKLTESDDASKHDDNFFFADRHEIKAYTPYVYTVKGVQLPKNDAHALSLFFDFGGTPAGSNVKISNIVFKKN